MRSAHESYRRKERGYRKSKHLPGMYVDDRTVFHRSQEWQDLRERVYAKYGPTCMKCGITDVSMHVDHIKPMSLYPELKFKFDNLQILCHLCDLAKSNTDETDYRGKQDE